MDTIGGIELRPYQERDISRFMDEPGCLVGYGKRGGKSITALALTMRRMETVGSGPILIVADVDTQFHRDLRKLGYPLGSIIEHGVSKERGYAAKRDAWRRAVKNPKHGVFYQIHWSALIHELELLRSVRWFTIIADELHAAKNWRSQRSKALKRIPCQYKIGLTADPDDNKPTDIWSLLQWIRPRQYTSFHRWARKYVEVYEETNRKTGKRYYDYGEPINVDEFRTEIAPFFVTMTLSDIDPGQPDDIFIERLVDMTIEQQAAYDQMVHMQLMELGDNIVMAEWPMTKDMRLQQLAQAMGRSETRLVWRTVNEFDGDGNKIKVRKQVETTRVIQTEPSPKLDDLMHILQTWDVGPMILYSQFPGMLDLVYKRLNDAGIRYASVRDRSQIPEAEAAFQDGAVDLIIGTTGIMSESIELSRARTIGFLDCPWNPRVRGQAIGRAKEVGKREPVTVIDWRTRGTRDMVRLDTARTKQQWKSALLGNREAI